MNEQQWLARVSARFCREPIWAAKRGIGSYLTFDVGSPFELPLLGGKSRTTGELHVWVQNCEWRLTGAGLDTWCEGEFEAELATLVGSSLVSMSAQNSPSGWSFDMGFSGGARLCLESKLAAYGPDADLVSVFLGRDEVLSLCPARGLYFGE